MLANDKGRKQTDPLVRTPFPGPKGKALIKQLSERPRLGGYENPRDPGYVLMMAAQRDGYVWDVDGNRFIDFNSGWATNNVGHPTKEIVDSAVEVLRDYGVVCSSDGIATIHRYELAGKLLQTLPNHIQRVAYCCTGTEAVEGAMKFMRAATGRSNIISFHANYHGLSYGAMAAGPLLSSMRDPVMQAMPGHIHTPYASCYRCAFKLEYPSCDLWCAEFIEDILTRYTAPPESIAGILVEPIQGEAGIWVPPEDYLPRLEKMCRKYGWLLCIDEVESGFGRSGKMWAFEYSDVKPDIVVIGKGISGSILPITAIAATPEVMDREVSVGSTFGGQPASCAAAIKALERIEKEGILQNCARLGEQGLERLRKMKERYPLIGDVRGRGLFLAIEFIKDHKTKERDYEIAKEIYYDCMENGLCLMYDSNWFARMLPVLDISADLFLRGLDIFEEAVQRADAKRRQERKAS
ncbi:MAG: aspartate aminotransferase family protein [Acidobacteriota bacterium]|nr:aspartate aminotransferase family protein [Acidobacteriota bacterium]